MATRRATKRNCRHIRIRGENWRIVIGRPPQNECRALCCYDLKTIFIRPSANDKIECVVHEILHVCFSDLQEEAVTEAGEAIAKGLLLLTKITDAE